MKNQAFTLIELLIVVAIIAILAAIAVPNFLEAQTRAKVSRVKADQRTLSTAIESYYVDNNRYPTDGIVGNRPQDGPSSTEALGYELTTPIAYISSLGIAQDPFIDNRDLPQGRDLFLYRNIRNLVDDQPSNTAFQAELEEISGAWRLISAGPDRFYLNAPDGQDFTNFACPNYDPTNGTVSTGDVYRTQKFGERREVF